MSAIDSTHIYGVVNSYVTMDNFAFRLLLSPLRLLIVVSKYLDNEIIRNFLGIFCDFFLNNYKSFEII